MKYYFTELSAVYSAKNKAHKEVQKFVSEFNHSVVSENEKALIINLIKQKIAEVNNEYTRCRDIHLSGWNYALESVAVDGNFQLSFIRINKFFPDSELSGRSQQSLSE